MVEHFEMASAFDTTPDVAPIAEGIEYPCVDCGGEAGPYSGRGRKPKRCASCKAPATTRTREPRVTGQAASLAAQATATLEQVNGLLALGVMALGFTQTAHAISAANPAFKEQAHAALLTDPELCRLILKTGGASSKMALGMAYVGMGMMVAPAAVIEYREKKAARDATAEE
jgi:hypothetical protein